MSKSSPSQHVPPSAAEPSGAPIASKPDLTKPAPGLYLVATPIGNLGDITLRALDVLHGADVVACEDTRVTRKLFAAYGIATPLASYHEHNAERMRPQLIKRIEKGEAVALVSDAGTPLIADPGHKLVGAAVEAGLAVTLLPGASAPLAALVLSGLPSDRFLFAGFPPSKPAARRRQLGELAAVPATLVFLESTQRLPSALADMADVFGPRPAAVGRELTKLHEEVRRGTLAELAAHYAEVGPPKGEAVIVIGPPQQAAPLSDAELDRRLRSALRDSSLRDAVAAVTAESGVARRRVYARALALTGGGGKRS